MLGQVIQREFSQTNKKIISLETPVLLEANCILWEETNNSSINQLWEYSIANESFYGKAGALIRIPKKNEN